MESHYLRLILLIIGGLIIVGIVWDGLRRKKRYRVTDTPDLGDIDEVNEDYDDPLVGNLDSVANKSQDDHLDNAQASMQAEEDLLTTQVSYDELVNEGDATQLSEDEQSSINESAFETTAVETSSNQDHASKSSSSNAAESKQKDSVTSDSDEASDATQANVEESLFADDLIIVSVQAKKGRQFSGYELLQAILSSGLRFGQQDLFHRHKETNGQGPILFSLAAAGNPGTFDMKKIGNFSCKGLILFMRLPVPKDGMAILDLLLSTANNLAEGLGGELKDSAAKPLSDASIASYKENIRKFEQGQMALDLVSDSARS